VGRTQSFIGGLPLIKKKAFLLLLILALTAACAEQKAPKAEPKAPQTAAPGPDSEENRQAAAKQYLEAVPPQEMLKEMTAGIGEKLPEPARKTLDSVMGGKAMQEASYQISLQALMKHFTANELKAMTAFYSTPEGKSSRQKYNAYLSEVVPGLHLEMIKEFEQMHKAEAPKTAPEPQKPETGKMPPESKAAPGPPAAQPGPPETKPAPPSAK
jgi:hypothetical protein